MHPISIMYQTAPFKLVFFVQVLKKIALPCGASSKLGRFFIHIYIYVYELTEKVTEVFQVDTHKAHLSVPKLHPHKSFMPQAQSSLEPT